MVRHKTNFCYPAVVQLLEQLTNNLKLECSNLATEDKLMAYLRYNILLTKTHTNVIMTLLTLQIKAICWSLCYLMSRAFLPQNTLV
jgi:hypothetical protein